MGGGLPGADVDGSGPSTSAPATGGMGGDVVDVDVDGAAPSTSALTKPPAIPPLLSTHPPPSKRGKGESGAGNLPSLTKRRKISSSEPSFASNLQRAFLAWRRALLEAPAAEKRAFYAQQDSEVSDLLSEMSAGLSKALAGKQLMCIMFFT